jgi:hypothetical protein
VRFRAVWNNWAAGLNHSKMDAVAARFPLERSGPPHRAGAVRRRAQSHCRFVLPRVHFTPYSLTYSVPLFLKRQCDRTLGAAASTEWVVDVITRISHCESFNISGTGYMAIYAAVRT